MTSRTLDFVLDVEKEIILLEIVILNEEEINITRV